MKKIIFTICTKSYLGLAKTLEKSVLKTTPDVVFKTVIIDEVDINDSINNDDSIILAKKVLPLDNRDWEHLAFKYTLTEFATTLKPYCFQYFFGEKCAYDKAIYLDPDTFLFSSLEVIFNKLDLASIVVTPHKVLFQDESLVDYKEYDYLKYGTFNLGFLALKSSNISYKLLQWWADKLFKYCFVDSVKHTATDQKWMNLLPSYFDYPDLYIDRSLGLNIAPWNFSERQIYKIGSEFYVKNRLDKNAVMEKIVFVHFSNYSYSELAKGIINHRALHHSYSDIDELFKFYINSLKEHMNIRYNAFKYTYNYYDNGMPISTLNRRLYRQLAEEGNLFDFPFSTKKGSLYSVFSESKLISKQITSKSRQTGFNQSENEPLKTAKKKTSKKQIFLLKLLSLIKFSVGLDNYLLLLNSVRSFSTYEKQVFLLKNKSAFKR